MLETALAEFVGDVLVNDCGRPVPDRVLRYHGTLPNDCCTDNGVLAVSWNTITPQGTECSAFPQAEVRLRYVVCWPVAEVDERGVTVDDATWDQRAAMLADVADCVTRGLLGLSCSDDDPLAQAVAAATVGRIRFLAAEPITPQGGCAGVQWRLTAGVRFGVSAS